MPNLSDSVIGKDRQQVSILDRQLFARLCLVDIDQDFILAT